jgi:DNA polymerase III epsilon subunit-like protein
MSLDEVESPPLSLVLTKHERKRLKKLRKRAEKIDNSLAFSGIAEATDLAELRELEKRDKGLQQHQPPLQMTQPQPERLAKYDVHVDWKNGKPQKSIGCASHRDLLSYLTDQVCEAAAARTTSSPCTENERKRKRNSAPETKKKPTATFNWISIHNKASLRQLCIVEAHWRGDMSLQDVANRMEQKFNESKVVVVPTQWFQASAKQPQDTTGGLMYQPPPNQPKMKSEKNAIDEWADASISITDQKLAPRMIMLQLSQQLMKNENFPCGNISLETTSATFAEERRLPSLINHSEAETFLASKWVTAKSLASNTNLDYVMHRQSWAARGTGPMIFALDCEMLETTMGIELGRATLCQFECYDASTGMTTTKLIFDVFVRPKNPVVDYKTQYSGLTAKILNDATKTVSLEQVQACVLQSVHPQDLVVGHSLENDLHALRWIHPTVIDTAVLFRRKGRSNSKCSLQLLARLLLKKEIQNPDRPHCSEEDAVTALELAIRRAVEGPRFDMASSPSMENWFTACSQRSLDVTFVGIGTNKWLQNNIVGSSTTAHAVVIGDTTNTKTGSCIATACNKIAQYRVAWARFAVDTIESLETAVAQINNADFRGVLVIALQSGMDAAKSMIEEKRSRRNPKATLQWTDADETRLGEAMRHARDGFVIYITHSPSADCDKQISAASS